MGRDLKVYYYTDRDDFNTDKYNGLPYDENMSRNLDLGNHDHFHGTKQDLADIIQELINAEGSFSDYVAVGNLSIILGNCPDECDYIVIEND